MAELIWEGKYKDGKKVAPVRIALPFQTVETVNESAQERQKMLGLFSSGQQTEWRNRLIWGDKKYVLPSLLPDFEGKVNLIYIDPPFDTGQDFSFVSTIPEFDGESDKEVLEFIKEPSVIEQKAYRDTWGGGLDSYLEWFYETAVLLRELLADDGSIYVHLDVHRGPYVKTVLDEVFGIENFQNEIAWYYYNKLHDSRKKLLPKAFDQILYYVKSKSSGYTYHALKEKRDSPVKKLKYKKVGGKIQNVFDESGKAITYMSEERTVDNVWRIRCLQPANKEERVNFDTQKPVDLIERILSISSDENDLVLDCFCGSGSSLVAAERMRRRWIGCDLGRFAIHTTRKRLMQIPNVRPFVVQNLGKYERQAWQAAEFPVEVGRKENTEANYRKFIIELYHATPVSSYTWLHGTKNGRMVHVGAVDAPVTLSDVKAIASEVWRAIGTGKDSPK
ncbi:MAG TPA: site-specific DNA-methyltransferase, partial [Verrucomicrobiae bacterium]|nr:site-specific DNA-methyltransferase [Verrucomicrobiae bacterium]